MVFAINGLHGPLETVEERLCPYHRRWKVNGIAQLIHIFQNLVEASEMFHNNLSMLFKDRNCDEQVEVCG